ncbi:hypothetical protein ACWCOW_37865 [Streptomyces sp. NPDC001939]
MDGNVTLISAPTAIVALVTAMAIAPCRDLTSQVIALQASFAAGHGTRTHRC